jgi:hypothetical protein
MPIRIDRLTSATGLATPRARDRDRMAETRKGLGVKPESRSGVAGRAQPQRPGYDPQKLESSLMRPPSPANTHGAIRRGLPCFGERVLPEGEDGDRSAMEMVGSGRERLDQD